MNQEFRATKGWSIFVYLFTIPLILLIGFFLVSLLAVIEFNRFIDFLIISVSIAAVWYLSYVFLITLKGKLIVYPDKVVEIGIFKKKELKLDEIKGYRIDYNNYHLIPIDDKAKSLRITRFIEGKLDFDSWLYGNFQQAAKIDIAKDVKHILANEEFGNTKEDRAKKFRQAKKVAQYLNIGGGVLAAMLLFYPKPYELLVFVALIFPLLIFVCLHKYKGLLCTQGRVNSGYPSIAIALILPSITLAYRSYLNYNIFDYSNFLLPVILLVVGTVIFILSTTKEFELKKAIDFFSVFSIVMFVFLYSYGWVISFNCMYDKSKPQVHTSEVTEMRIYNGRSNMYYIKVAPWGPVDKTIEIRVSKILHESLEIGDSVNINLMEGKMSIPWGTAEKL